jgi:serine protease Do
MTRLLGPRMVVAVALLVALALPATVLARAPEAGFADLVERVGPAVVNVQVQKASPQRDSRPALPEVPPGSPFEDFFREFFDRERPPETPRRDASVGSGFVIDPEGFVVTNNHVIADANEISVVFTDERQYRAELIGRDPKTDLALLKIEGNGPFPFVEWADSDIVRVGDWMLAIGNPFGLGSTVTAGIVSARGRDIASGPYDDYIQVDAAINRGNSGGPSFTMDGKVFGVNTAIFSPSGGNVGIGFAIPSNLARPVIASLKSTGRVARGWLGVRIQSVTEDIAETMGLAEAQGALVAQITPGGPAEAADIEVGDVIVRFDGKDVTRMRSLPRIVAETEVGKEVNVELIRRRERLTVRVTLGELPEDDQLAELGQPPGPEAPTQSAVVIEDLGVKVEPLSQEIRQQFSLSESAKGVVVVEVQEGSPAAQEALQAGDVIVELDQEAVGSPPELLARVRQAKQDGKKAALLLVDRQGDLRFVPLRFKT